MACSLPTITSPVATPDATGTQCTLTWTTNVPADTQVKYGINNGAISTPLIDAIGVTSHSVTLTGLLPSTVYSWAAQSRAIDAGSTCPSANWAYYGGPASSISFTTSVAPAGTFDYYVTPDGPKNVVQGYNLYMFLRMGLLVGTYTTNSLTITVTGVPANCTCHWVNQQDFGQNAGAAKVSTTTITNDTVNLNQLNNNEFRLGVGANATPGNYTLTFTVTGSALPTHIVTWPITIHSTSTPYGISFPYGTPSSYPVIPNLTDWQGAMTTYALQACAEDYDATRTIRANNNSNLCGVSPGEQKCAWYYDGVRVYYQISEYLNDLPTYNQCRANIHAIYRDGYLLPNGGVIQTWLFFPEGIYKDYLRTGEPANLAALDAMAKNLYNLGNGQFTGLWGYQRELAYCFKVAYFENKLGRTQSHSTQGTAFWVSYLLDHILGMLDCLAVTKSPGVYTESWMFGLLVDILLTYFEDGNQSDSRIPALVKLAADYMYTNYYNNISDDLGTFQYDTVRGYSEGNALWNQGIANSGASPTTLELMLVIPWWAWLWKMTGISSYQTNGDTLWSYGVLVVGASGQGGGLSGTLGFQPTGAGHNNGNKQFSQYFYWTHKYVKWRSAPVATTFGTGVNLTSSSGVSFQ